MASSRAARAGFSKWKNKTYGANDKQYGFRKGIALSPTRPMFY